MGRPHRYSCQEICCEKGVGAKNDPLWREFFPRPSPVDRSGDALYKVVQPASVWEPCLFLSSSGQGAFVT